MRGAAGGVALRCPAVVSCDKPWVRRDAPWPSSLQADRGGSSRSEGRRETEQDRTHFPYAQ